VPAGKPYQLITAAELPADYSSRDAWTVDEADLTDGQGSPVGAGSDWDVLAILNEIPQVLIQHRLTQEMKVYDFRDDEFLDIPAEAMAQPENGEPS
jgi:hypothetical protein